MRLGLGLGLSRPSGSGLGAGTPAGPTLLVSHTYTGANSAVSVGTPDVGPEPTVYGGASFGITSNQMYYAVAGGGNAVLAYDAGSANVYISAIIKEPLGTDYKARMAVRIIDGSNLLRLYMDTTQAVLVVVTADAATTLEAVPITGTVNDRIGVRCSGNTLRIVHNDVEIGAGSTSAQGNTATLHGFQAFNPAPSVALWDDLLIYTAS